MRIDKVSLKGIRGFVDEVDLSFDDPSVDEVPQWIVLAGRNGTGKTTLLRAIALAIAGPDVARRLVDSFAHWVSVGAAQGTASVQVAWDGDVDRMVESGRVAEFKPWAGIRWTRQNEGPEPAIEPYLRGRKWLARRGPWAENPRGWFLGGYGPFRRLSGASGDVVKLMVLPGRTSAMASLFREDATLSESVEWLRQVDYRSRDRQEVRGLVDDVLELLRAGLLPEDVTVDRVDSDGLWITANGTQLPVSELSDGYRAVASLVLDIVRSLATAYGELQAAPDDALGTVVSNSGVVLIDEIDAHLHPSWQQMIGPWLKDHFPNLQFIVSTHSPFICQAADRGGLIRLPTPGAGPPRAVDESLYYRVINGTVDEPLLSELFGLDFTYSREAQQARQELARLEAGALRSRLSAEEEDRYKQLQFELVEPFEDRSPS